VAAERRPGSDRGRPTLDWNQAFLFYAALPSERRDYAAVAAEFEVSVRTVERHGREEHWRERALEIDREATATAAAQLADQRAATLSDIEKLAKAHLVGHAQMLREGKVRFSTADLLRVHKLLRELWEEPLVRAPEQSPPRPCDEGPDPFEHKLQVLRALRESGVFDPLELPGDPDRAHADDDRDRERDADAGDLPPQNGGAR
jgi:hypothetical protein